MIAQRRKAWARLARLTHVVAALALAGCGKGGGEPLRQPLVLVAVEHGSVPVEGARFWADGVELGASGVDGRLRTALSGRAGQRVALSAACPAGYAPGTERRAVVLRTVQGAAAPALELRVSCQRLEQLAALVVRATGPVPRSIPIRVRGEVVGQTDGDGVAHVLLRARAGSTLRVRLDTSSAPRLSPASPTRTFHVGSDPEVFLFDQRFEPERPGGRRRHGRARAVTAGRPYRLH